MRANSGDDSRDILILRRGLSLTSTSVRRLSIDSLWWMEVPFLFNLDGETSSIPKVRLSVVVIVADG